MRTRALDPIGTANRDLVKLFHSYQATKPFSGTDEAISSNPRSYSEADA
jgi:hypothetical protein